MPGPRGPSGEDGASITDVVLDPDQPELGMPPTVDFEAIGDGSGDLRVLIGIPPGQPGADGEDGQPGPRGPGITSVVVTTLEAGQDATAVLEPIEGDEENDYELLLGVPEGEKGDQGDPGGVVWPEVTRITALSWIHDAVCFGGSGELFEELQTLGLVIEFDGDVEVATIVRQGQTDNNPTSLVYELLIRSSGDCWCPVPGLICEPLESVVSYEEGRIREVNPFGPDENPEYARAFRLRMPEGGELNMINPVARVVFRADFALDRNARAVDGNHIGGLVSGRPGDEPIEPIKSGNNVQGGTFYSWFEVRF